jgi:hypothetical protein
MTQQDKLQTLANLITAQQVDRLKQDRLCCQANLDNAKTKIIPGIKYTKIDIGGSGRFMIDEDGEIYGIKAYGVIHRGHHYGNLDTIDAWYWGEYYPVNCTRHA